MTSTKNPRLSDKPIMVPARDRKADEMAKFLFKHPTRCPKHEENVTRFCVDHDALLCHVCELTNHKHCSHYLTLKDAADGIRGSRECAILENEIKKLTESYENMQKEQTGILEDVQMKEKEFVKAVKTFRREIDLLLDRLEHAVLAHKEDYATKRKQIIKEHKHSCTTALTYLQTFNKDLHRTFLAADDQSMFLAVKKTKLVTSAYSQQLKIIAQSPKKVVLSFQPNKAVAKYFMTLKELGVMKVDQSTKNVAVSHGQPNTDRRQSNGGNNVMTTSPKCSNRQSPLNVRSQKRIQSQSELLELPLISPSYDNRLLNVIQKTRRPVHIGDVSMRLETDEQAPLITGMTFLADDSFIVADENNRNVKLYTLTFKPVAIVCLNAPPCDVTSVKSRQIVVSISSKKTLQFVDVTEQLTLSSKLTLEFECYGVAFYQNELYVTSGFSQGRKIVILSLKGDVRKQITSPLADLRYPLYVTADNQRKAVFVTDYNHGVVGIEASSGKVIFKCKNTDVHTYYKGITIGHKGNLFVCTWNLNGVSMVHLDGRGLETIISIAGQEGRKPQCVTFSRKSERLVVSLCGSNSSTISVYRYQ